MTKVSFVLNGLLFCAIKANAQDVDTSQIRALPTVTVQTTSVRNTISRLNPIEGTYIHAGKKNEVVSLSQIDANITQKTCRQLFAKVPGIFVYDMDGGNQMNIAARGLDPHRGWEFNIRKDGVLTNSDMYAYPASHYSIPLESVEKIELVRGTGSLQYGAQFGGMLNYVTKEGSATKPFSFESFNTLGSYQLKSTFNAVGGTFKKIKYYAYHSVRSRNGYRTNEHTNYNAEGVVISYNASEKFSFRAEWARSTYLFRLPGPLTDAMFKIDPTQATRGRNYYSPTINIPSITIKWQLTDQTKIQFTSSAVIGSRNSVLYDKVASIKDTINTAIGSFNNRQVDIDRFNSYTQELRFIGQYNLAHKKHTTVAGIQRMDNDLHRNQLGKGSPGGDYNLALVDPQWGRDMHFKTDNLALFAEHNAAILENLSVNFGARVEIGKSKMSGRIVYYPENAIPVSINHNFTLFGAGFLYKPQRAVELYGGISQTYRPMIFKDIVPGSTFEKIDPNIKDANGYNAELGCRGKLSQFQWDITVFLLQYNNRFGTIALTDDLGAFYTYRTNIGNSATKGIELFVQYNLAASKYIQINVFTSTSYMNGQYTSGKLKSGNTNIDISGNKIESVPNIISRNGLTVQFRKASCTVLYSYTSSTFADALNTVAPNASGAVGLVPSYATFDINISYKISNNIELKASIANLADNQYFTKRPLFYPGPGIWPSDGRNASFSAIVRI